MVIFPLAPDQITVQMWSNGVEGEDLHPYLLHYTYNNTDNISDKPTNMTRQLLSASNWTSAAPQDLLNLWWTASSLHLHRRPQRMRQHTSS